MCEALVRDVGAGEDEAFEGGEALQMHQASVRDSGAGEVEPLKTVQFPHMFEVGVGDAAVAEIQHGSLSGQVSYRSIRDSKLGDKKPLQGVAKCHARRPHFAGEGRSRFISSTRQELFPDDTKTRSRNSGKSRTIASAHGNQFVINGLSLRARRSKCIPCGRKMAALRSPGSSFDKTSEDDGPPTVQRYTTHFKSRLQSGLARVRDVRPTEADPRKGSEAPQICNANVRDSGVGEAEPLNGDEALQMGKARVRDFGAL